MEFNRLFNPELVTTFELEKDLSKCIRESKGKEQRELIKTWIMVQEYKRKSEIIITTPLETGAAITAPQIFTNVVLSIICLILPFITFALFK